MTSATRISRRTRPRRRLRRPRPARASATRRSAEPRPRSRALATPARRRPTSESRGLPAREDSGSDSTRTRACGRSSAFATTARARLSSSTRGPSLAAYECAEEGDQPTRVGVLRADEDGAYVARDEETGREGEPVRGCSTSSTRCSCGTARGSGTFDAYDFDGDGALNAGEPLGSSRGAPDATDADAVFDVVLDVDGDGVVAFGELIQVVKKCREAGAAMRSEVKGGGTRAGSFAAGSPGNPEIRKTLLAAAGLSASASASVHA